MDTFGEPFWNFEMFSIFENISKTRPSMQHWAKQFFERITPTLVQDTFGHFGKDFGLFWNFENFLIFLKTFRRLDPPWNTGQNNFSKELPQHLFKTRLDILGRILGIFGILKIFDFWKHFEDSTLHGTLGKIIFRKNYPNTCSKHVWTFWEGFWAFLEFWKIFNFFENISKARPSMEHWAKLFFRKNYPKTCSKHVWTLLGTTLGFFGILKIFVFLRSFRRLDPTWNTGQKKLFEKYPKTCSRHFWTIWEQFWSFLEFWKFFDFLKTFRRLDPTWNTGQKNFSENLPQNLLKTCLDTFGNDFGHSWKFESFLIFWKHFEDSTLHRTLCKKNSEESTPKHVRNTFGQFGYNFKRFWIFEFF